MITLEALEGDPHALLAELRVREPVAWVEVLDGWLVTRRDLALAAMRDAETFTVHDPRFTTARVVGESMLSLDGPEHARHRAPFTAPFRLAAVRDQLAGAVREETELLLDALAPAGEGELRRGFAGPLAAAVVTRTLGLEHAEVDRVLGWYDAIVGAVTDLSAGRPAGPEAARAVDALRAAVVPSLAAAGFSTGGPHDAGGTHSGGGPPPGGGPPSGGGPAPGGGPPSGGGAPSGGPAGLTPAEAASNAAVLLFGGIETTEGMIANAVLHLLERPDALSRVRADAALLPAAVEESLRLEPAASVIDRYATRDVRLGGADVAAGDLVRISITAANRDPATFPDPDRFDLDRPNAGRHLAFAGGPHVCVGMHLARVEAHVALERVLARLPGLRLTAPAQIRGLVFRKPPALHAAWG